MALYRPAPLFAPNTVYIVFYLVCVLCLVTPACTGSLPVMEKSSKMIKKINCMFCLTVTAMFPLCLSVCPSFIFLASSSAFTTHLPCIGLVRPGLFTKCLPISPSAPYRLIGLVCTSVSSPVLVNFSASFARLSVLELLFFCLVNKYWILSLISCIWIQMLSSFCDSSVDLHRNFCRADVGRWMHF